MGRARNWTREEEEYITFNWGEHNVETIATHLNRSIDAVLQRAHYLKLGPMRRGRYTMTDLIRITGYDHLAIKAMCQRIGLIPSRQASRDPKYKRYRTSSRWYSFTHEDLETLIKAFDKAGYPKRVERVAAGVWGSKGLNYEIPPACLRCNRSHSRHIARGLCESCLKFVYRKNLKSEYPPIRFGKDENS